MKIKLPGDGTAECPSTLLAAVRAAFPEWRGRKLRLEVAERLRMNDAWPDGGTWSDYALARLADGRVSPVPDLVSGGYAPDAMKWYRALASVEIPVGCAVLAHRRFCGRDVGVTITLRPENVAPALGTGG